MSKEIAYDIKARATLKKGVDKLANAVRVTLGPKGRNVVIEKKFGSPTVIRITSTIIAKKTRNIRFMIIEGSGVPSNAIRIIRK